MSTDLKEHSPTARFYISCHKPSVTIENEIIKPVRQKDVIAFLSEGTEEDKFMAAHANEYCELLTQYWAWKYEEADYYGFGHYRRYFSFADKDRTDAFHIVRENYLCDRTAALYGLKDVDKMLRTIENADFITPVPYSYDVKTVYDQYKQAQKLHIEDLDFILEAIERFTPEFKHAARTYMQSNKLYICNMFFMTKALFQDYSRWLFGLLRKFYEFRDMEAEHYNPEAMRTPGHLGERLFGIYVTWLNEKAQYKHSELNIITFAHTDPLQTLAPAFDKANVPIFMATNARYAKYTAATLQSILEHASPSHNYDVIVLHNNLEASDTERLTAVVRGVGNLSLRFFNPEQLFESYQLYESATITKETYYRLIIPEYFPRYDKALYLDSDLVVLDDVANLFETELGDNYIGGAIDICHAGNVNGFDPDMRAYYEQFHFKNIYTLINAGVLILDTAKLRRDFSTSYLLSFAQQGNFRFQDQDLLNILCEDKILYLDSKWNFFADPIDSYRGYTRSFAPKIYYDAYMRAESDIKILHYAGNEKPWFFPNNQYALYFWKYFRKTPFYGCVEFDRTPITPAQKDKLLRRIVFKLCPKGTRRRQLAKKLYWFLKGDRHHG